MALPQVSLTPELMLDDLKTKPGGSKCRIIVVVICVFSLQVVSFPLLTEPVTNSYFNLLLFAVAPEPTSADVLTLSIKDATTSSPLSAPDNQTVQTLRPVNTEAPPTEAPPTPGVEPEPEPKSSDRATPPTNLTVTNVTSTRVSFVVELSSPSGPTQGHVTSLPGSVREAEIEGLSPSTDYDITLQGLVEGNRSLPLRVFATTGT